MTLDGTNTPMQHGPIQPVGTSPVKRAGAEGMAMLALFAGVGHRANPPRLRQEPGGDQIGAELRCRPGQRCAGDLPQAIVAPGQLTAEVGRTVTLGLEQPLFVLELEMTRLVITGRLRNDMAGNGKTPRHMRKLATRSAKHRSE